MPRIFVCLVLAALVVSTGARGDVVSDLYTAIVPVSDQSSKELDKAARAALAQVLVKVTGSQGVLRNPGMAGTLRAARAEVLQYSYLPAKDRDAPMRVRMEFDSSMVTELIIREGEPLWTANRPAVLVWLTVEDAGGPRFANEEDSPELVAALRDAFSERGLPLRLPLYDLTDAAAISAEDAWKLSASALEAASSRYGVQHIVGARLTTPSGDQWVGDWAYLRGAQRDDQVIRATSSQDCLRQGVAAVAESLAARYAVVPSTDPSVPVTVLVSGVEAYEDLAAIVNWLEALELVQRAFVARVAGDQLELQLFARVSAGELATLIELNRRFSAITTSPLATRLEYQWRN